MVGRFEQGCGASARNEEGLNPGDCAHAGPMRVLLLSGDCGTARLIDELLHAAWSQAHLVTHATWNAAAAEALLDPPGCCVPLDAAPDSEPQEDPLTLL